MAAIAALAGGVSAARAESAGLVGGDAWVQASSFKADDASAILTQVTQRAAALKAAGKPAVVVFDLDSTLFDNGPRQEKIAHEFAKTMVNDGRFKGDAAKLARFASKNASFSLSSMLASVGIDTATESGKAFLAAYEPFWRERFFANDYVQYDRAYPKAAETVARVYATGVAIVYLTGRHRAYAAKTDKDLFTDGMEQGTRAVIVRDRMPLDEKRAILIMKDAFAERDEDFKRRAAARIRELGTVIATFDNEPANVAVFADAFPDAMNVWVATIDSGRPARPLVGAYKFGGRSNDSAGWPSSQESKR